MRLSLFVIRALFFICAVGTGSYIARVAGDAHLQLPYMAVAAAIAALVILSEVFFSKSPVAMVSAVVFGVTIGFLVAWLFTGLIEIIVQNLTTLRPQDVSAIRLVLTLICVYYGITVILQTKDDFKFIIPYVEFSRELRGSRPLVLDSSALIDGRIEALCATGLVDAPVVAPRFVIDELQALADSQDKAKRAKGRRGLDVLRAIREQGKAPVEIADREPAGAAGAPVDRKLVLIAKELAGKLVTTDAALAKLAVLEGVRVIGLHEVARALQARALVGDRLSLKLVKPGEGAEQAVGYLEDGSMVVVERARARLGEQATIEITSGIRTSAGQMFFAKLVEGDGAPSPQSAPRA
jgi:uncharacterized protein YacL